MLPPVELTTPPARGVIRLSSGREARIVAVSTGDPWPPGTALEWLGDSPPAPQPATITTTAGGLSAAVWVLTVAGVEAVLEAPLARVLVDAGPPRIVARVRVDAGWTAGESTESLLTDAVVGPPGVGISGVEIVGGHLMVTLSDATVIDAGELTGGSVDLSGYYTSAQVDELLATAVGAPAQDVYPLTVTAPLVIAPGMAGTVTPWPSDRTIGLVVTQDATGGHVVTYDSIIDTTVGAGVRTDAGAVTAIYLTPLGGGLWRAVSDYITGTSPAPTLAAPTIATTPVSSTSFSVSYSTPETATAWQYSLDGAPDASLDGTSPDTISVTPGLSGVVAVRYQAGGVWSPYTTVAYSTVVTTTYRALTYGTGAATLTGDVTSGVGATATADTWLTTVHMLPRGVDGEVQVRMATAGATSGQVELYLRSDGLVQPSGGTASVAFGGKAICVSTTGGWVWGSPGAAQVSGGVAQAAGDVLRVRRVGLTVEGHVSKDEGDTWTSIGASTAASDPGVALIPCLRLAAGRQTTWLKTAGTALWADTDAALATQRLTVSAGATGITESGDANAGWAYALSNAAGYAWCPLGDASSDATSSAIVVKLTSLTAGVAGCRVYMSNQASPSGTYPPPGDYDAMAINAAHAVSSWQSAAHIGLTTGPNNFGITAKVGDAIHAVSLAAGGSALWYDDQQRVRMVGSWPWATDSVIVDIPSSSGHASLSVSRASRA